MTLFLLRSLTFICLPPYNNIIDQEKWKNSPGKQKKEVHMSLKDTISKAITNDTPAVTLDDSLETAIRRMVGEGCSALAVKSGDELIGIVTDMDIMESIRRSGLAGGVKVADFMVKCDLLSQQGTKSPCVQLDEDESVENALKLMAGAGVHHLLVSGNNNRAIGIVSSQALLSLVLS
jgi:CBS domain-containing protein